MATKHGERACDQIQGFFETNLLSVKNSERAGYIFFFEITGSLPKPRELASFVLTATREYGQDLRVAVVSLSDEETMFCGGKKAAEELAYNFDGEVEFEEENARWIFFRDAAFSFDEIKEAFL